MSKIQKSKKLRRPNIPLDSGPRTALGGGQDPSPTLRATASVEQVQFDYTHIKKDLTRIMVLAIGFIIVLVGLSFAMPYIIK